jgi:hypothetical protein
LAIPCGVSRPAYPCRKQVAASHATPSQNPALMIEADDFFTRKFNIGIHRICMGRTNSLCFYRLVPLSDDSDVAGD